MPTAADQGPIARPVRLASRSTPSRPWSSRQAAVSEDADRASQLHLSKVSLYRWQIRVEPPQDSYRANLNTLRKSPYVAQTYLLAQRDLAFGLGLWGLAVVSALDVRPPPNPVTAPALALAAGRQRSARITESIAICAARDR